MTWWRAGSRSTKRTTTPVPRTTVGGWAPNHDITDSYEWLHGYDVSFGIIDRDRTVRPSARVLQAEALGDG